jgi:hypothetical protein
VARADVRWVDDRYLLATGSDRQVLARVEDHRDDTGAFREAEGEDPLGDHLDQCAECRTTAASAMTASAMTHERDDRERCALQRPTSSHS